MPDLFRHPPRGTFFGMGERQPCVSMQAGASNGTLYVGVTSNLPARIVQHREGTIEGFTKRHAIKRLAWFERVETMADAIAHEKRLKKWPRDWKKTLIERENPHWRDFAVALGR